MKPAERTAVRYAAYGGYVVCSVGAAASVGTPWGWAAGVLLAAVPGVAMMRYELDEKSVKRDRAGGWDKKERPAQGPAPDSLGDPVPPEVPPAF